MSKRKSPRPPKYCLHKATGQAYVTIGGRPRYLGAHGSPESEEKYRRLIAGWASHGGHMPPTAPSDGGLSVTELCVRYYEHAQLHYRDKDGQPTSELACIRAALRRLRALYGGTSAAAFGPLALKAVRQHMVDEGLARSTVNSNVKRVRRAFAWAVENELVTPTVLEGLRAVRGLQRGRSTARERGPVLPVSEADIRAVLPHVSPQVQAMIWVMFWSGCRPGEVVQMTTGTIDRETYAPTWCFLPDRHKTQYAGRDRAVMLGPEAQAILRPWLRAAPDEPLFQPREAEAARLSERGTQRGRPPGTTYSTTSLRHAIQRACSRAKIPPWGPNRLRHCAATRIRATDGIDAAQQVLGHSTPAVTAVYAEASRAKAAEIMARVG